MKKYIIFLDRPASRTKRVEMFASDILSACDAARTKHGGIVSMVWPVWPYVYSK